MVKLDYLLVFSNSGLPIYSYNFDEKFVVTDDILFSAFLASLNQISGYNADVPKEMMIEEEKVVISYSEELHLSTIHMESLILFFYNVEGMDLVIGVGVKPKNFSSFTTLIQISQLMADTTKYLTQFNNHNWNSINYTITSKFDNEYLTDILHNHVEAHDSTEICFLGDKCPYKLHPEYDDKEFEEKKQSRFRSVFSRKNKEN